MSESEEPLPTEWDRLSDAEKSQRVREGSDMDASDVVVESGGDTTASKETVDPTTLDWRRVWDDYDIWDGYKPLGETKLSLALDAHREIYVGMPESNAIGRAVDAGRLVEVGMRYVPTEAHGGSR